MGGAERMDTLMVEVSEVEAQISAMFYSKATEERLLPAPPTLEEMLVGGTVAATMLATLFTEQQQPHVAFPLSFSRDGNTGHRRAQAGTEYLYVEMETLAPTAAEANRALEQIAAETGGSFLGGHGRRMQQEEPSTPLQDLQIRVAELEKLLAEKV